MGSRLADGLPAAFNLWRPEMATKTYNPNSHNLETLDTFPNGSASIDLCRVRSKAGKNLGFLLHDKANQTCTDIITLEEAKAEFARCTANLPTLPATIDQIHFATEFPGVVITSGTLQDHDGNPAGFYVAKKGDTEERFDFASEADATARYDALVEETRQALDCDITPAKDFGKLTIDDAIEGDLYHNFTKRQIVRLIRQAPDRNGDMHFTIEIFDPDAKTRTRDTKGSGYVLYEIRDADMEAAENIVAEIAREPRQKRQDASDAPDPDPIEDPKPKAAPKKTKEPAAPKEPKPRDPRLPEPNTPITATYNNHTITIFEQPDRTFMGSVDNGKAKPFKSITAACNGLLLDAGWPEDRLKSTPNAYDFFGLQGSTGVAGIQRIDAIKQRIGADPLTAAKAIHDLLQKNPPKPNALSWLEEALGIS